MKKKVIIAVVTLVLVFCFTVGGTLAWLQTETTSVVNTFTYGDINIDLEETDTGVDGDDDPTTNSYKMVPGNTIEKDPVVTVKVGSEACWLFVKIEKSSNYSTYLEDYVIADGWTALSGVDGVYYREVDALTAEGAEAAKFAVLKDNQVKVKTSVTKTQMEAIRESGMPTLTFTAYAVQKDNVNSASTAWTIANPTT